jgi:hypothetical protein
MLAFEEIAPIVGRSPAAARQLAGRMRRRVRGTGTDTVLALTSGNSEKWPKPFSLLCAPVMLRGFQLY